MMKLYSNILALLLLLSSVSAAVHGEGSLSDDPLVRSWLEGQRGSVGRSDTSVTIKNGTVRGTTFKAVGGSTIYAYLGIPYAAAPTGALRFEPPKPYDVKFGPEGFDGTKQPNACPQWITNTTFATEDCLFISVYTKRGVNNTGAPLPVMYWIHGGGFLLGQTSYYQASKLLAEEVVFVSVQYRLGPLGFLTTGDDIVPGNNGMKDMVQGLRWVKENIAAFGGDPGKVTVFGESAGAAASIYMLVSPIAQGLFHQVAAMSGTAIAEWSIDRNGVEYTKALAVKVNCTTENPTAMVECFRKLDWEVISETHFTMLLSSQANQLKVLLSGTSPVIEKNIPGAFLPDEPLKLLQEGPLAQVPVLMGSVQQEGSFLLGAAFILRFSVTHELDDSTYIHDKLVGDLLATWGVDESVNGASVSQALSLGYLDQGPRTNFSDITYGLMDMLSSMFMKAPILRTAEILSRRMPAVYLYSFEYAGRNSLWNFIPLVIEVLGIGEAPPFRGGITHADDLIYMFNLPFIPSAPDRDFSKIYCKMFTNFAISGSPAPVASETYPVWPQFSIDQPRYMVLNGTPNVQTDYPQSWRKGLLS